MYAVLLANINVGVEFHKEECAVDGTRRKERHPSKVGDLI